MEISFAFIIFIYAIAGPGPARYTMPNLTGQRAHDPTKKLNPCYSFGTKLATSCKYMIFSIKTIIYIDCYCCHFF